jgi:hypothetical protein
MLCHVGIDEQEQNTRIKELSDEHTIGNVGQPHTVRVMPNRLYQIDDNFLKNQIDSDNYERN